MEALSKIQETKRILRLLEDETRQLKEKLGENDIDLAESLETQNKEASVLINDLEADIESLNHENIQLKEASGEEQLITKDKENNFLKNEVESLLGKVSKLEEEVKEYENELFAIKKDHDDKEFFQEKLTLVESQNTELTKKVLDQEAILKQQEDTISSLRGDSKLVKGQLLQAVERKIDEMAKEFLKNFEDNIKMMRQRIRIAEQLHTENKEICRRIKEKCQLEHSGLDKKVKAYSRMIATSKIDFVNLFNEANERLTGLESSVERFEAREADFSDRISQATDDVIVMKNLIKEKKDVRKMDEKIKKEKDENLRLMRMMDELKKRVNKLEQAAVEKEEAIFKLVEEKKEVIRQLSMSAEYHQNRYDQLLKSFSKSYKA